MFKKILVALVIIVLVFVAGVWVAGCGQTLQVSSPNYFPHNDGYSWEYACKQTVGTSESSWTKTYYFDGTATLSDGRIVQKLMVSEEATATSIKCSSFAGTSGYYQIDDSGVRHYGSLSHPTTEATLILPFPLDVGNTWERGAIGTFEVIGVETVDVPAGSFSTFKVGLQEEGFEMYEWYADGVGMVKSYMRFPCTNLEDGRIVPVERVITCEVISKIF